MATIDWSQGYPRVVKEGFQQEVTDNGTIWTQPSDNGRVQVFGDFDPYRSAGYADLTAAGQWNLAPGGQLWNYLQGGHSGDRGLETMAHQLMRMGIPPEQWPQALQGVDQGTAQRLLQHVKGQQEVLAKPHTGSLFDVIEPYMVPAVMALMGNVAGAAGAAPAAGVSEGGLAAELAAGAPTEALAGASGAGSALGGGSLMPAAIPEVDPTFGGVLTQTGAGQFENLANIEAFGGALAPTLAGGAPSAAQVSTNGSALAPTGIGVGDALTIAGLARGIPGVLGAIAADKQADAYRSQADQYMAHGAPARARFEASYAPGFSMADDPGFLDAMNQAAKATLHGLSIHGNPAGSPNAWAKSLTDLFQQQAYRGLQDYRNMNAGAGGLAALTAAAPGAASNAIRSEGNVYSALGGAAADIFNPPKSLEQILKQMKSY